jgi:ankyrin repeat protein
MSKCLRLMAILSSTMVLCACQTAVGPSAGWWSDIAEDRAGMVRKQLQQGVDPNMVSPEGQPAIMQAIRDGAWDVYDALARDPRTDVNATNKHQETPLMYLAVTGETRRAIVLIHRGAEVNRLGWTPLQYAASTGKLDTVKMLIASKALVNAPAPDGSTALMMAARAGSDKVVRYLLASGADASMRNLENMDAADWARLKGHDELAASLDAQTQRIIAQRDVQRKANAAARAGSSSAAANAEARAGANGGGTVDADAFVAPDGSAAASRSSASSYSKGGAGAAASSSSATSSSSTSSSSGSSGWNSAPSGGWQGGGLLGDGSHGRLVPGTGGALNGAEPAAAPKVQAAPKAAPESPEPSRSGPSYFDLDRFNR